MGSVGVSGRRLDAETRSYTHSDVDHRGQAVAGWGGEGARRWGFTGRKKRGGGLVSYTAQSAV